MSKIEPPAADAPTANPPIMLDEFCRELSAGDSRVELIAGFHASEVAEGRTQATRETYARRFTAYRKRPVA
jgi:hypothetical protein